MDKRLSLEHRENISYFIGRGITLVLLLLSSCAPVPRPTFQPAEATPTHDPPRRTPTVFTPPPTGIPTLSVEPDINLGVDREELENVEIRFWHPWSGETGRAVRELVDEFNRSNEWGIKVLADDQAGYDDLFENVAAALEAGTQPDVVAGYYYQGLDWHRGGERLVELTPYVEDPLWGLTLEERADFYPGFWQQELWDDGRFGIPAQRTAQVLYYNLSWAEELGFTRLPSTSSQFRRQACAAASALLNDADRDNDGSGGLIISTDYNAILNWILAFDGEVVNARGSRYQFNTPEVEAAFTFLRVLYDEGCAWLSEQELPELDFASRRGLFSIGSAAGIPAQEAAFANLGSRDDWTVIPFPSGSSEAAIAAFGPSFMVFQSKPDRQLAAWLLIKWLTSPASQARIAQASAHFPVRASSLEVMDLLPRTYPQWGVAASFLSSARPEPPFASWRIVRWAVSDASTQLFRYYFEVDQVPQLIKLLDETANDLHASFP